jgi:ribosomal protein S15P/S13E
VEENLATKILRLQQHLPLHLRDHGKSLPLKDG